MSHEAAVYDLATGEIPVLDRPGYVLRVPHGKRLEVNGLSVDCPCAVGPGDRIALRDLDLLIAHGVTAALAAVRGVIAGRRPPPPLPPIPVLPEIPDLPTDLDEADLFDVSDLGDDDSTSP